MPDEKGKLRDGAWEAGIWAVVSVLHGHGKTKIGNLHVIGDDYRKATEPNWFVYFVYSCLFS